MQIGLHVQQNYLYFKQLFMFIVICQRKFNIGGKKGKKNREKKNEIEVIFLQL
jgi:hypothetical protein